MALETFSYDVLFGCVDLVSKIVSLSQHILYPSDVDTVRGFLTSVLFYHADFSG